MAEDTNKNEALTTGAGAGATTGGSLNTGTANFSKAPETPVTTKPIGTTRLDSSSGSTAGSGDHDEAKSHFNAAVDEAKKAVTALKSEAGTKANAYKDQARERGQGYSQQAKEYGDQARSKASEYAVDGKAKASQALLSLSEMVNDNASSVDETLGAKYGDYARSASRSLRDTADRLDQKSVEELGEDAREYIRENPAVAVGAAALAGFLLARSFSSSRS